MIENRGRKYPTVCSISTQSCMRRSKKNKTEDMHSSCNSKILVAECFTLIRRWVDYEECTMYSDITLSGSQIGSLGKSKGI